MGLGLELLGPLGYRPNADRLAGRGAVLREGCRPLHHPKKKERERKNERDVGVGFPVVSAQAVLAYALLRNA